jgi:predicted transcriptional regulator
VHKKQLSRVIRESTDAAAAYEAYISQNIARSFIMNVSDICRRNVITVRRFDELIKAAQLMREKHVGYLVVVEPNLENELERTVGVLTDRDLVISVLAREADPRNLRVEDVMTRQPVTIGEAESIEKGLLEMRRVGVRRLPVAGKRGELVGILSLDDVLDVLAGELQNVAGSIRKEQRVEGVLRP